MSALAVSCAAFLGAETCGFENDVHGLASAICRGDANEVTRLLRAGVSPNATSGGGTKECGGAGAKPLDVAISCEQTQFVPILLAAGADPNCRTQPEHVPLHYAAWRGDLLAARALVAAGANVNAVDRDGHSILACATENGNAELITFLKAHGAVMEGHPEIWQTIHELSYVTRFFKGTRCESKENLRSRR
jgi:hypothetical protein